MNKRRLLLLLLIAPSTFAWADDAVEAAATGNIVFETTPELTMQDETLIITREASEHLGKELFNIDVDFHFKNNSDHDVTRKIAFVLPPVYCRMDKNSLWRGLDSVDPYGQPNMGLKDFTTTVDSQPQSFTQRAEAMLGKKNITKQLIALNLPRNPCMILTKEGSPSPKYLQHLKKHHLLTSADEPAWSENIYFEWTQTFPAGKITHIQHHYTPVIGESVLSSRSLKELNDEMTTDARSLSPIWNRHPQTLLQTDPSLVKNTSPERFCVMPQWVQYHLTTGAKWRGGIGLFKLIINDHAGLPFSVNPFYNNAQMAHMTVNGNTMTFEIQHFIPTENLFVLFLSRPQDSADFEACAS